MLEQLGGDTLHPRAKEKPQQDSRRGKIAFRTNSYLSETFREQKTNLVCSLYDPKTLQRLRQNCV